MTGAHLAPNKVAQGTRITGADRVSWQKDLKTQYEKGASVRALAEATGRSYGFVHRVLGEAGVVMRPRGGYRRRPKAKVTDVTNLRSRNVREGS
jgi:hypothetical protein